MHCNSARPREQHCNAPVFVVCHSDHSSVQQKRKKKRNSSSLKQGTIHSQSLFHPLRFFLFSFSPLRVLLSPFTIPPSASFFDFFFCGSDVSEIIRLPSWLDMDSMGRFDLDFLLQACTHIWSYTHAYTCIHMHMHTRCAWHKPRTSWVEIVFGLEIFQCQGCCQPRR